MLRGYFQRIFKNYQKEKKNDFIGNPIVKLIEADIPAYLREINPNPDNYVFRGNAGKGSFTEAPYIAIMDREITDQVGKGYYVIYIFSKDTNRLYLSLNQAIIGIDGDGGNQGSIERIKEQASRYRHYLGETPSNFSLERLDLGNPSFLNRFEVGNVYGKEYTLENLPSEEELESDLNEMLDVYTKLKKKIPKVWKISPGSSRIEGQKNLWPLFEKEGFIGIGWLHDSQNYTEFQTLDELKDALIEFYPNYKDKDPTQAARMVWDFTHNIKEGDIIVANKGLGKVRGIGTVKSEYIGPKDQENPGIFNYFWHLRKVDWKITDELELKQNLFDRKTVTELSESKWNEIKQSYLIRNPDYLDLFKEIESSYPVEVGIKDFIKQVLENYLNAKNNPTLAKELVTFANGGNFHKYLIDIANQSGIGDYGTYGDFGSSANLKWLPFVQIKRKNVIPWNIRYVFREDMQGVYLSINQAPWTMDYRIKKKKLDIQKFSQEFEDCLRKDAVNARLKLNQSIDIPDNLLEKISLASENATSASSIEAGNVFARYYTLENLPSESQLISDFKEFVNLYENLSDKRDPNDLNIRDSLEIIFKELPLAKKRGEKPKKHEVGKAFSNIRDAIFEIANSIHPDKSYNVIAYYQSYGNWYKLPYIYIEDQANKDKFGHWDQHYVGFWFKEDLEGVCLSLQQGRNYAENFLGKKFGHYSGEDLQNYLDDHSKQIKEQLEDSVISADFIEKSMPTAFSDMTIYGKYYDKNNLPSNDQIISDFKELFNLYSLLKPDANGGRKLTFFDDLANQGYFFDHKLVENFLLSLKVKPFVILTGNSGTGKTKVAQLFAEYLNPQAIRKPYKKISKKVLPIKRTITTYSRKHRGGWRIQPEELEDIKDLHYDSNSSFSYNIDLEISFNGRSLTGKGYIETRDVSYSEDPQSYVYYDEDSEINKELKQISSGEVTINFGKPMGINVIVKRHEIIPVGANWTENRHILGFYNVITEKYQGTEALDLILSAINDTEEPYFLILDEMNLSHVERYFSDFLSAMESEEDIELHQAITGEAKDEQHQLPPSKIKLSENLMIVGTVNIDETTYMFSPKVLDRANTLEFLTQSAEEYMSGSPQYSVTGDLDYLQNPLSDVDIKNEVNIRTENIMQLQNRLNEVKTGDNQELWGVLSRNIGQFQGILKEADFDFGFRTINEIIRFMYVAWQYEHRPNQWENWERYFDAQIMQKMLPKLHGSQKELSKVLEILEQKCAKGNFPSSTEKIKWMRKTLKDKRYVSFTG